MPVRSWRWFQGESIPRFAGHPVRRFFTAAFGLAAFWGPTPSADFARRCRLARMASRIQQLDRSPGDVICRGDMRLLGTHKNAEEYCAIGTMVVTIWDFDCPQWTHGRCVIGSLLEAIASKPFGANSPPAAKFAPLSATNRLGISTATACSGFEPCASSHLATVPSPYILSLRQQAARSFGGDVCLGF